MKKNRPIILVTLGPSSLNGQAIEKLSERGVSYFRINMSHTNIEELQGTISTIRKYSDTKICIDSEGAQVRTAVMPGGIYFSDRQIITLSAKKIGDGNTIGLWPSDVFNNIKVGNILTVDFDSLLLSVISVEDTEVKALVINGGSVGSNKAVTIFPSSKLPPLSQKDRDAIKMGLENGVKDFALSFTNSSADVKKMRKLVGESARIISKIESRSGVRNLDEILTLADAILIDRGDLSREVPIENIPTLQKMIIKKAQGANKSVFVATNLLESMISNRKPTRAEISDVMNTLLDGANGLVLAAETAIGNFPIQSVDVLRKLILQYIDSLNGYTINDLLIHESSLLPKLHGADNHSFKLSTISSEKSFKNIDGLPTIDIDEDIYSDCVQINDNVFSPLKGFMNSEDLSSVLKDYKLANGQIWTMPIILQIPKSTWSILTFGSIVRLYCKKYDATSVLRINDIYELNLEDVSMQWFGSNDQNHPGVKKFQKKGKYVIGGELINIETNSSIYPQYQLTPEQTRMIFNIKGWSRIIGFHTRNIPHRAHEYIMNKALQKVNADGLLIQPVVGSKKKGDFVSDVILKAYDLLIEKKLAGAILSAFSTYSRYSGPREAVFTALCRKNYGCTHFIIGRDHTGVADFYKGKNIVELFESLGDIGIEIIFFNKVGFSLNEGKMIEIKAKNELKNIENISGTFVRNSLRQNIEIPEYFIRKEILDLLKKRLKKGQRLFV